MLSLGKKMMCVYGPKPNQTGGGTAETRTTTSLEDFLGEGKKVTVRVRLFPRESQPCSSTRWWTIAVKGRGLFRRNSHCKITERVGTRTFTTTEGRRSVQGKTISISGQLKDDSVAGRYFLLRLEQGLSDEVSYEGTLTRSKDSHSEGEITHDAVVFTDQSPW